MRFHEGLHSGEVETCYWEAGSVSESFKNLLCLLLAILATMLLVLGILIAYNDWNALIGIVVLLLAWILVSLVQTFLKRSVKA